MLDLFELVEIGDAGSRAFGFWLWAFSPRYRARVAATWHQRTLLGRAGLLLELLLSAALGAALPVLVWLVVV